MKRSKWKRNEQALFLLKLGELLENGYPLSHAIQFLKLQESKKKAAELTETLLRLREGNPLYSSLVYMKFHPQLISYIYYAESHGNLVQALKEGGSFWLKRTEDLERINKLLVYPIFLLVFVANIFYILQRVLLPKFQVLFQSMDAEPNIFLTIVLAVSRFLPALPVILLVLLVITLGLRKYWFLRLNPLKRRKILQRIPFLGRFLKLYDTHFFSSQLSGLLSGGLSINESIRLFSENNSQPFYQKLCLFIKKELTEGKSLEDIFQTVPFFEEHLSIIIANGQKYGTLDQELFHYSRYVLTKIEEKTSAATRIIQPVLFSVIGLLIVSIYLAILMPMFSLLGSL
ncbi:competence type IV pilus assembly protein ComGB [Peribacillus cavernae]|nr:competence type IV pilus assembly protein ComGB [Peribacillus cavernae]MDQ0218331.1 competence protein ComGB [Peribacillus cavernae]